MKTQYEKPEAFQVNERVKVYSCDGLACSKMCAKTLTVSEWNDYRCHYTTDPEHAASRFDAAHNIAVAQLLGLRREL